MAEYVRPKFVSKNHPVHDPAFAAAWGRAHPFCMACGGERDGLTNHHIIGGRGGRSDEACVLFRACWHPCHQVIEGHRIKINGAYLPKLTLGIVLSMKKRAGELTDADLERLQALHGKRLPDLEEIPSEFVGCFQRNREACRG